MSRYCIKQKSFTERDKFSVYDTNGNVRYACMVKRFAFRKPALTISTPIGAELYNIKLGGGMRSALTVYRRDGGKNVKVAVVKQKFSLAYKKAVAESSYYGNYTIRGNVREWDFNIKEGLSEDGEICVTVLRRNSHKPSLTYEIDVVRGKEAYMVSLAVCTYYLYTKNTKSVAQATN